MAIELENEDLVAAYKLMKLALEMRPKGALIRRKIDEYEKKLAILKKINESVTSGEIAIVPVGFRCFTKPKIRKLLGISQESLPFDYGFFSPSSVASLLLNPRVELSFPDHEQKTHAVCIKDNDHVDTDLGNGIKFISTDYDKIEEYISAASSKEEINKYLDSTYGYYTLDKTHGYVLAHYNWHPLSDAKKSKGITDPKINIPKINDIMNRRLQRLFDKCNRARKVFFIYDRPKRHRHITIDNEVYDLDDLEPIQDALKFLFSKKAKLLLINELRSPEKMLENA